MGTLGIFWLGWFAIGVGVGWGIWKWDRVTCFRIISVIDVIIAVLLWPIPCCGYVWRLGRLIGNGVWKGVERGLEELGNFLAMEVPKPEELAERKRRREKGGIEVIPAQFSEEEKSLKEAQKELEDGLIANLPAWGIKDEVAVTISATNLPKKSEGLVTGGSPIVARVTTERIKRELEESSKKLEGGAK